MSDQVEVTQEQLDKFPPELHSVARRHGVDLLTFALMVAGTNVAVDKLLQLGDRLVSARAPATIVLTNMSAFCEIVVKMKGWEMEQVMECMQDVGRATDLVKVGRSMH